MWGTLAVNLAILGVSYAYHRHEQKALKNKQQPPRPAREISVPRTDDGAPIPILYGRCRVREAWLAWVGTPEVTAAEDEFDPSVTDGAPFSYRMDMFFVLGIPFVNGGNLVRKVWVDDVALGSGFGANGPGVEATMDNSANRGGAGLIGSLGEFYDGNDAQLFCNETTPFAPLTAAGVRMEAAEGTGATVPSFQRFLSAFLYNSIGGWMIGNSQRPGAYSFEALSYPAVGLATAIGEFGPVNSTRITEECNPADAALDLLTGIFGKLGIPIAYIDVPSFTAAAQVFLDEEHGYSRSIEGGMTGEEALVELQEQVDGIIRENPATDKIEFKLVRPDYDPSDLLDLNPSNCTIDDYEPGNWDNVITKVRVVFKSREKSYQDDSATAFNNANARSQIGNPDELVLQMPGVCTMALAQTIAERELSFRSRPIATARVRCSKAAIRKSIGDVVTLTWPDYGLNKRTFRISKADRGKPGDPDIVLHLMQEVYSVNRGAFDLVEYPGIPAHR